MSDKERSIDREQINNLLTGSLLGRIDKATFGAAMTSLANQSVDTPVLTEERFLHMHIEAQTGLLLRILDMLEDISVRVQIIQEETK